jgi:hypothetical protein
MEEEEKRSARKRSRRSSNRQISDDEDEDEEEQDQETSDNNNEEIDETLDQEWDSDNNKRNKKKRKTKAAITPEKKKRRSRESNSRSSSGSDGERGSDIIANRRPRRQSAIQAEKLTKVQFDEINEIESKDVVIGIVDLVDEDEDNDKSSVADLVSDTGGQTSETSNQEPSYLGMVDLLENDT